MSARDHYGVPVRVGAEVRIVGSFGGDRFVVRAIEGDRVKLAPITPGHGATVDAKDLWVWHGVD